MNKRVAINLAVFLAVFAAMLVWAAGNIVTVDRLEQPYPLEVDLAAASGLLPRAEVAYLGVSAGSVDHVERVPGGVRAFLKVNNDVEIPVGSTANVFRKSAIGEPFIDFFPPEGYTGGGPFMEPGDVVPRELTTTPLEFSELLRSASSLIRGIDPERLDVLIHDLALAVEGRSDDLRLLTVSSDEVTATFAARTELLDRLADNNTRLTRVVTESRGDLGSSITDLRALAASLRAAEGDTQVLLQRGGAFLGETADLVADQKGNLDCVLTDLERLIATATTPERVADLRRTLDIAPVGYGAVFATRDVEPDGVWVRVGLITNPQNPSRQYTPPEPIPAVPAVAPCSSNLVASGVDVDVSDGGGTPFSLPRDGGPLALVAVLTGMTAVAVLRGTSLPKRA